MWFWKSFYDQRGTFALTNLVKHKVSFKNKNGNCFQKTTICEIGLSDCNKLIIIIFRSTFIKLPPKTVTYKSYKHFNEKNFVHELDQKLFQGDICKTDNSYSKLPDVCSKLCTYKIKNY